MKKSFKFAAMMATAVLSVSSFISCDDEEKFDSETITVELPRDSQIIGFGASYSYH